MAYAKKVAGWTSLLILLAASPGRAQTKGREYVVVQAFALHHEVNGVEGTLQLLMDKRLTRPVGEKLWGKGEWSFVFPKDSTLYKEFSALPPGNSELRITDSRGKVIARRDLEMPLAKLEPWNPVSSANQFFLLTQDYSTGAGSYNGPGTIVLRITGGNFHDAKALDAESHVKKPIRLAKSLKSDWRISRRGNEGEILSVSCHPLDDGNFVIDYVRYALEEGRWLEYKRQVQGFWESDEPFPERSAFR